MAKILVVDDETDLEILIKQKFRQKIREGGLSFHFRGERQRGLEPIRTPPRRRRGAQRYQHA